LAAVKTISQPIGNLNENLVPRFFITVNYIQIKKLPKKEGISQQTVKCKILQWELAFP